MPAVSSVERPASAAAGKTPNTIELHTEDH